MTRLLFYAWLVLACAGYATTSNASGVGYPFTFEVRIPKSANPDIKTTRVVLLRHHGRNVTYLWVCKQREEGGFLVFQKEFLLRAQDKSQRGLIVRPFPAASQVFRLSIPETPKPQDWSQWQRPSYVEAGDAVSTFFLPDGPVPGRSTNVPPVCFEVRYKIGSIKIE